LSDSAEAITREILDWAGAVLPGSIVVTRPLGARERGVGVDVRLLALTPRPAPRIANPPNVLDLDYLVTVSLGDANAEQNALAELVLAAVDRSDFEIVGTRSAADTCAALGIPVAAGFLLRTPLMRGRAAKTAPLVRFPLKVTSGDICVVEGSVLGPNDVPVAGAVVTMPGLGREARTDTHGRFRFPAALRDPNGIKLNVRARGVELDASAMPGENVVVHLPLEV
jgi:hypothetical protein